MKSKTTPKAKAKTPVATTPRTQFRILSGGSHRGARENQRAFQRFNEASTQTELVPVYVDPEPARAEETAALAREKGIPAEAIEARIEDVLPTRKEPLVIQLDRPSSIVDVLVMLDRAPTAVLGYLLIRLPSDTLLGFRMALRATDAPLRAQGRRFFETAAKATARAGATYVLGDEAPAPNRLAEPLYREWFARHAEENLSKLVAGTEPSAAPFEATLDGTTTVTLLITLRETLGEPIEVVREAMRDPSTPIARGTDLLVAEVTPDTIRFHEARRQVTDGALMVRGLDLFEQQALARTSTESVLDRELARIEAERGGSGASSLISTLWADDGDETYATKTTTLATASRTDPIYTTD